VTANQNPPNEWQQWLRAGVLVKAKENIFASGRQQEGITTTFADKWRPVGDAVLRKGELALCLGELSRRKVAAGNIRGEKMVVGTWYFLFPSGMFVANPECFEEGAPDLDV
jgi:hypothetical protein